MDNDYAAFLESAWNVLQTGYDLFTLTRSIFDENNKDAVDDALDTGELKVPWKSLTSIPFVANMTSKDFGVRGDLYLTDAQSIYGLASDKFTDVGNNGNMYITSTTGGDKILDIGTKQMWLKTLSTSNFSSSNANINSNLQVPFISTSNITSQTITLTSNIQTPYLNTSTQIKVGPYYIRSDGIWLGDPITNPLTSYVIIDTQGNYKGTIDRNQITNLEAFNLASVANGNLVWGDFGVAN